MCLIVDKIKHEIDEFGFPIPKIAKKDIPVYKVIRKDNRGCYHQLCINYTVEPWTQGFEYEELEFHRIREVIKPDYLKILSNAFHSNVFRKDTKTIKEECEYYNKDKAYKIVKMYIPEGAKYYEGYWGDNTSIKQYASNRLVWYNDEDK